MSITIKLTITLEEACNMLGIRRTAFYKLRKSDPTFPKPIESLSKRDLHFSARDIHHWIETARRA